MERLKILIAGGTGFIGGNLARFFLSKGHEVAITVRNESNLWRISDLAQNLTMVKVDLTNINDIKGVFSSFKPEVVINAAAFGGYHFESDSNRIFDVNLKATMNLVEAYVDSNSELLLNTGSSSEYGIKEVPMSENDLIEPLGNYSVSKAAATLFCRSRALETNRKIVTCRLFSAFGYYEEPHRLIPYILLSMLHGTTIKLNDPNNVRDFVFIEDICDAYNKIITRTNAVNVGAIFNVGSGVETPISQIVKNVEKISGEKLNITWGSNGNRPANAASHWVANVFKIKNDLDWKPSFSLEQGLSKMYGWLKENISKYEVMENSKARKLGI